MMEFNREGEEDRRKVLRAHWPPRLHNVVQVDIPDWLYADLYACAQAEGWSLSDEIRSRLREGMPLKSAEARQREAGR